MMQLLKHKLRKILPLPIKDFLSNIYGLYFGGYKTKSYSQEGEDIVLNRIFDIINPNLKGFYIDVGAHHPIRFSNTYLFYKKGWRGINIDAMPKSMLAFDKKRTRDINIETPISDQEDTLTFYIFNEPALNGFSKDFSTQRDKDPKNDFYIKDTKDINTRTLNSVLDEHMSPIQRIDFLTIDVEGYDLKVLKSLNLIKYRPKFILVEILETDFSNIFDNDITEFLISNNYFFFAKTVNTAFFCSSASIDDLAIDYTSSVL
jgi:FkbM family methyltransferase